MNHKSQKTRSSRHKTRKRSRRPRRPSRPRRADKRHAVEAQIIDDDAPMRLREAVAYFRSHGSDDDTVLRKASALATYADNNGMRVRGIWQDCGEGTESLEGLRDLLATVRSGRLRGWVLIVPYLSHLSSDATMAFSLVHEITSAGIFVDVIFEDEEDPDLRYAGPIDVV